MRLAGAKIGKNVRICSNVSIIGNGSLVIGDNTWIGHETMIICSADIIIGSNVNIAPRCCVGTGTHEINYDTTIPNIAGKGLSFPIIIGDGCWMCWFYLISRLFYRKSNYNSSRICCIGIVGSREIWEAFWLSL